MYRLGVGSRWHSKTTFVTYYILSTTINIIDCSITDLAVEMWLTRVVHSCDWLGQPLWKGPYVGYH